MLHRVPYAMRLRCLPLILVAALFLLALPVYGQDPPPNTGAAAPPPPPPIPILGRPKKPTKPPPVNMVVQVGYEGWIRAERPAPIRVTLDNTQAAMTGRLELRASGNSAVSVTPVELPFRSRKEYTLFAPLTPDQNHPQGASAELRLYSGPKEIARQILIPRLLESGMLVLSASGDGSGLQFLNKAKVDRYLEDKPPFQAVHLSPADLPRQWAGYAAVDVVTVNGRAWGQMDDEQRRALRMWVESGGAAILCGEATTEWRDLEARSLIPIMPTDLAGVPEIAGLARWGGTPFRAQAGTILTVSGPARPGSQSLVDVSGRLILLQAEAGAGTMLWLGFDPFRPAFSAWAGQRKFWTQALNLAVGKRRNSGSEVEMPADAVAAARALPRLPAPPLWALVAFGVVYAVIFGPVNIWMLRRLRRTVRAWLFMPCLALGMTVVVLFLGQRWGSSRTVLNEISILRTQSGLMTAREQSLIGLFSPTNRAFDLTVEDPAPKLNDTGSGDATGVTDQRVTLGWPNQQEDGLVRWEAVPMQLFSTLVLREERPIDLRGAVEIRREGTRVTTLPGNLLTGTTRITNGSALTLADAYLAENDRYCSLGTLPPGGKVSRDGKAWKAGQPALSVRQERLGEGMENIRFRESLHRLWQAAPKELLSSGERKDAWLIARCDGYRGGLQVAEVPYSNRAALVLVRLPAPVP